VDWQERRDKGSISVETSLLCCYVVLLVSFCNKTLRVGVSTSSSPLMATHANCLPIGAVISDFEIIGLVGEGGFGIVYLARDRSLDRVVALKEFMPAAFAGRVDGVKVAVRSATQSHTFNAGLQSFIKEAKLLARFSHPALVEVYRFWEDNGTGYMAMRFYQGETLRQKLQAGQMRFDESAIAQIMSPIFDAIEMLHREQVFHRDIAPDNIMLTDTNRPVLLDFGSARHIIGDGTQALTTILKPGYAPVEQYVDDGTMKQGAWTDVYALGGVLYHLATGRAPMQAVSRLLADPLQPVSQATGGAFSDRFSQAVAKAMAVRVEDRLQNIRELRDLLGWSVVKSEQLVTLPSSPKAPTLPHPPHPSNPPVAAQAPVANPTAPAPAPRPPTVPHAEPVLQSESAVPPYRPTPDAPLSKPLNWGLLGGVTLVIAAVFGWLVSSRPSAPPAASAAPAAAAVATLPPPGAAAPVAPAAPVTPVTPVTPSAPAPTPAPTPSDPAPTPGPQVAAAPRLGVLNLSVSPWGTVVIDGVTKGISNANQLRTIELAEGSHKLEIAKPNSPTLTQTIEVSADAPLSIQHKFK
jgi:serine/threonine protein kinase